MTTIRTMVLEIVIIVCFSKNTFLRGGDSSKKLSTRLPSVRLEVTELLHKCDHGIPHFMGPGDRTQVQSSKLPLPRPKPAVTSWKGPPPPSVFCVHLLGCARPHLGHDRPLDRLTTGQCGGGGVGVGTDLYQIHFVHQAEHPRRIGVGNNGPLDASKVFQIPRDGHSA